MTKDDLISRQAAINNIKNGFHWETVNGIMAQAVLKQVIHDIEIMPSVQPEPLWVPVSERLPEEDIRSYAPYDEHLSAFVLASLEGQTWPYNKRTVKLARYSYSRKKWKIPSNQLGEVVAWMPLPECYQGE